VRSRSTVSQVGQDVSKEAPGSVIHQVGPACGSFGCQERMVTNAISKSRRSVKVEAGNAGWVVSFAAKVYVLSNRHQSTPLEWITLLSSCNLVSDKDNFIAQVVCDKVIELVGSCSEVVETLEKVTVRRKLPCVSVKWGQCVEERIKMVVSLITVVSNLYQ
jgi:hypothetical protein